MGGIVESIARSFRFPAEGEWGFAGSLTRLWFLAKGFGWGAEHHGLGSRTRIWFVRAAIDRPGANSFFEAS